MMLTARRLLVSWTAVAVFGVQALTGFAQTSADTSLADALTKLDAYAKDAMAKTKVPGVSVAVVYQDQVVFLRGYGVREKGKPGRVDPDTVFEIASFSKAIASTVVAAVVGRGEVSWDSRIQDLDPDFRLSNPSISEQVTVRDFLSHRSTLPEPSGDTLEALGYTRPEILYKLRLVPLEGVFRKTYQYSNFGLTEGALAATRHLGESWEQVSEDLLYSKLGMTRTSSRFSDYNNRSNRSALHYLSDDGVFRSRYVRDADAESPAGGVNSSARDLAQWLRLQLAGGAFNGQQVVDRTALMETHTPQVCRNPEQNSPNGPVCPGNSYYGLGWNVDYRASGETQLSHSGAFMLGAATAVYMIPNKQIGILVLTNGSPVGLPEAIALNFLDFFEYGAARKDYLAILQQDYLGLRQGVLSSSKDYSKEKPPSNPSPGGATSSFVGTYTNPYYGKVEIEEQQGKLILRLPPLGAYYELSHWDGNIYTYYIANEVSGAARRGVCFSGDGNEVTVENLDFEYSNVFKRVR
jgi:CubicO group peptidase (beta-lactamase class C family)